ncbi:MAG: DUF2263 domain-containing protein, partial [Gammaproteobacteria bacterium]|nr:DUF2263 domain-containing protein [Gammaproteobacteria bacterium]
TGIKQMGGAYLLQCESDVKGPFDSLEMCEAKKTQLTTQKLQIATSASRLIAKKFGRKLPNPSRLDKDPRNRLRQIILFETLRLFEAQSDGLYYHRLARDNLARWAVTAANKSQKSQSTCVVSVIEGDWGDVTHQLTKEHGVCFAVLNMANAYRPGGGYTSGASAQEENMIRRTDCHFALDRNEMKTRDNKLIYTDRFTDLINGKNGYVYLDTTNPRVCIRGSEKFNAPNLGYELLPNDEIFPFYELRAAAVNLKGREHLYNHHETRKRVAAQLDTLIRHGVRHVVLSAFGCGAFKNPAEEVARAYHEELQLMRRWTHFDVIVFAIFFAGNGPNNFEAFK